MSKLSSGLSILCGLIGLVAGACTTPSNGEVPSTPCIAAYHCKHDGEGFVCEDGYVWEDPNDADNYRCVAKEPSTDAGENSSGDDQNSSDITGSDDSDLDELTDDDESRSDQESQVSSDSSITDDDTGDESADVTTADDESSDGNTVDETSDDGDTLSDESGDDDDAELSVDDGPYLNSGWIGGACASDDDCAYEGGFCVFDDDGYPFGMCTKACAQYCPDQDGPLNSVTFCVDDDGDADDGFCVARCDYTISETGCRDGYVCLPEKRMNQPDMVRDVCVPLEGWPDRDPPPYDIGEGCVVDADCERNTCVGLPGGYCSQEQCHLVGCPTGSTCYQLGQTEDYFVCLDNCQQPSDCREDDGYTCDSDDVCWLAPPPPYQCTLSGSANDCEDFAGIASDDFVVVTKGQRRLTLCDGAVAQDVWCVGLGFSPVLDKEQEGDGRTPEGVFYIPQTLPNSSYYKAFLLSYPDADDAQRGLDEGLITQSEYDAIVSAQQNQGKPPQTTALGGLIEIHGMGSGQDWTAGCIAVDNDVIDILWPVLGVGDTIVVLP